MSFQSTLPVRGATGREWQRRSIGMISIHAPRAGSDVKRRIPGDADIAISIHAPRAGSDAKAETLPARTRISIHAPRAGSDGCVCIYICNPWYFNPRSPCGERRSRPACGCCRAQNFNPRSPCGERQQCAAVDSVLGDFNPRSPCGERPESACALCAGYEFQSTLPVRGATQRIRRGILEQVYFNPRSPCGERRCRSCAVGENQHDFNPRSPCGERPGMALRGHGAQNFNPRSPCGERLELRMEQEGRQIFQSTLPVRGATIDCDIRRMPKEISIHAPRAGSDPLSCTRGIASHVFQSTLPVRGATYHMAEIQESRQISIHAPRAGSDRGVPHPQYLPPHFNPRSPCGERRCTTTTPSAT